MAETLTRNKARRKKAYDSVRADTLPNSIAVGTISSIPRWHRARYIFSQRNSETASATSATPCCGLKTAPPIHLSMILDTSSLQNARLYVYCLVSLSMRMVFGSLFYARFSEHWYNWLTLRKICFHFVFDDLIPTFFRVDCKFRDL